MIVNSSETDIRGTWITQRTGIAGICEVIEHIYALSEKDYTAMQIKCRKRVESHFTVSKMVDCYEDIYQKILHKQPELVPANKRVGKATNSKG